VGASDASVAKFTLFERLHDARAARFSAIHALDPPACAKRVLASLPSSCEYALIASRTTLPENRAGLARSGTAFNGTGQQHDLGECDGFLRSAPRSRRARAASGASCSGLTSAESGAGGPPCSTDAPDRAADLSCSNDSDLHAPAMRER